MMNQKFEFLFAFQFLSLLAFILPQGNLYINRVAEAVVITKFEITASDKKIGAEGDLIFNNVEYNNPFSTETEFDFTVNADYSAYLNGLESKTVNFTIKQ